MSSHWTFGLMRTLRDGISPDDILIAARDRDARATDSTVRMRPEFLQVIGDGDLRLKANGSGFPLTDRAYHHVARLIGRPGIIGETLRNLPAESLDKLVHSSALTFPDQSTVRLYRMPDESTVCRGILSDRYHVRPAAPVVESVLRILDRAGTGDRDTTRGIVGSDMTGDPHRWSLRLSRTDWQQEVVTGLDQPGPVPGGIVYPIVDARSDDSGGGAVSLTAGIWRLVCNNGSSIRESAAVARIIHRQGARWSRSVGDLIPAGWMDSIRAAAQDTVRLPRMDAATLATLFRAHADSPWREVAETSRLSLTAEDLARILSAESIEDEGRARYRNGDPVSRWALAQSAALVGRTYREADRTDRAEACETASGALLSMPLSRALPALDAVAIA